MNDRLFRTILKKYEAEIEDANYKIDAICEHNLVIPEHVDITGEVDKQVRQKHSYKVRTHRVRKGSQGFAKWGLGSQKYGQLWQKYVFLTVLPQFGHKSAKAKGVFRTLPNPPDTPGVATFYQ